MTGPRMCFVNLFALICGSSAHAQSFSDYPQARIETYQVRGNTSAEIFASITRNAPGTIPGTIGAGQQAHASAYTQFHWTKRQSGGFCEFEVRMESHVVFPQHIDPAGLSDEAWRWWSDYARTLERHEAGHLKIAHETYPDLLFALENGPCDTANARAEAVLEDLNYRQARYDRVTNHGANQAAISARSFR